MLRVNSPLSALSRAKRPTLSNSMACVANGLAPSMELYEASKANLRVVDLVPFCEGMLIVFGGFVSGKNVIRA